MAVGTKLSISCREEEVCTLSVAGGDEGGINATFAPVHRGEKKGLTATGIAAVLHCVPSWLRAGRRQKAEMAENRGCRGKIAKKT